MPTISSFYGITIVMFLRDKEHDPPHIHALTQEYAAPFLISNGEIMSGFFPPKAKELVKQFVLLHRDELLEMWTTEVYRRIPPIR